MCYVSESFRSVPKRFLYPGYSPYPSRIARADERTRTADLISLRVIHQALQGLAQDCKSRISKRLSLLRVAACCTVLRSRWYQSGINIALMLVSHHRPPAARQILPMKDEHRSGEEPLRVWLPSLRR